ncbi:MAG: hypothetical protein FJ202_03205 [Gemmatimonadetes bacterium]|nr:hypothetical protein [Gemmatimonadota bacterium]
MQSRWVRLPGIASVAVLAAGFAVPKPLAAPRPLVESVELRIVATTDVHGYLRGWDYFGDSTDTARGLARVATIVDSVRAAHPDGTVLVDAGDFMQGNALAYVASKPDARGAHPVIAAMNAMRYDAVALGNHEFNYGVPFLDRVRTQAAFPILAANARRLDNGRPFPAMTTIDRAGLSIAIIGATNPGSMAWDRDHLKGRVHVSDLAAPVAAAVDSARRSGADLVVVVAHAGLASNGAPGFPEELGRENPMASVAREVRGIDVIVLGHSHRELADTVINGVLITQARNWATSAAVAELTVERSANGNKRPTAKVVRRRGQIVRAAGHAESPAIVEASAAAHATARAWASRTVATTDVAWSTGSARTEDSPLVDFIGETMRRATGADLASTAVFTTRAKIPAGPITVAQIARLYPYDNTIRVVRISGADLKAYLEHSARYFAVAGAGKTATAKPDPTIPGFNFEVVTGASYTLDLSRPIGDRVRALKVGGKPVTAGGSFTMAVSNYRATGAGGYSMVAAAPVVKDDQREVRQLLIDEATAKGAIRPGDYFTANWRLLPVALRTSAQRAIAAEGDFDSRPAARPVRPGQAAETIRIISTNDFHGALEPRSVGNIGMLGGAAHLAAMIRSLERECTGGCASILLDGGDMFQGTPASNLGFGRPVVALFNAMGYAAAALGNHEFDWGQDTLRARMRDAKFAILAANVRDTAGRVPSWIRRDTIVERGGVRIGIIGLSTTATPRTTRAVNVRDLRFLEPAPVVRERARSLRDRGARLVFIVAHEGGFCNRECEGEILTLAGQVNTDIDAIVSGHTHSELATVVRGVPVIQARSSGTAVAWVDLPVRREDRTSLAPRAARVKTDSITPDPQILELVRAAVEPVLPLVQQPIVNVAERLARDGEQYPLGNLIADAQRVAARADIAVMNNGGIRAALNAGQANYGALFEIQPFANTLVRVTARGSDVREYFERVVGARAVNAHIAGATIRYDSSRPRGSRILELRVAGEPLDDAKSYTISLNDFMATGGDGLGFADRALRVESLDIVDLDALIAFARAAPGGVLRADATVRIVDVSRP